MNLNKLTSFTLTALLLVELFVISSIQAQSVNLPEVLGAIDVTKPPYSADNTGKRDATEALSHAMLDAGRRTPGVFTTTDRAVQIVYLPKGTYRVSDTLCFEDAAVRDHRKELIQAHPDLRYIEGHMMLVGESREETIIKLDDRSAKFQNGRVPMVQMSIKPANNQAYYNTVRDLTLDSGLGNPGAMAMHFVSNNLGTVRNVLIRCRDNRHPAAVGLDLSTPMGGLGYIRDVTVEGFVTGIFVANYHPGYTFENITLFGQGEVGMDCSDKSAQILNLRSTNKVLALRNRTPAGQVVLLNSSLAGGAAGACAIENDGYLFVRDVDVQGYAQAIRSHEQTVAPGHVTEFLSHGQSLKLWPSAPGASLNLEIRDTPVMPPLEKEAWTVFDPSVQEDDTAALQSLIDSGAEAILVRGAKGRLRLTDTIKIRGNLRRFHGGWCNLSLENPAKDGRPLFEVFTGAHPVTVIEAFSSGQCLYDFTDIVNRSNRTVVLKDMFFGYGRATYRNTGMGDLFLESVVSGGGDYDTLGMRKETGWLVRNQRVWARNWNPEDYLPGIRLDHAQGWCLGAKLGEIHGPYLELVNAARMEMLGCVLNSGPRKYWADDRAGNSIAIDGSDLSFVGVDRLWDRMGEGPSPFMITEIRKGETRKLAHENLPRRWPGNSNNLSVVIPLYRSAGKSQPEKSFSNNQKKLP